jgi:transposase InsO family protein
VASFWLSVQNELLNRKKWMTRLELTIAICDYVEAFYNRQRRHSSLDYVSPVEFELSILCFRSGMKSRQTA